MNKKCIRTFAVAMLGVSMAANATVTIVDPTNCTGWKKGFSYDANKWQGSSEPSTDLYSIPNPTDSTKQLHLVEAFYDGTNSDTEPLVQEIDQLYGGYYAMTVYAAANATGKQTGEAVQDGATDVAYLKMYTSRHKGWYWYSVGNNKFIDEDSKRTYTVPITSYNSEKVGKLKKYTIFFQQAPFDIDGQTPYDGYDFTRTRISMGLNDVTKTNLYLIQIASLKKLQELQIFEGTDLYPKWQEAQANYENSTASEEAKAAYKAVIDKVDEYQRAYLNTVDDANAGATKIKEQIKVLNEALKEYVKAGAKPTKGHSFDLTFMLQNANMDGDSSTGWTATTTPERIGSNVVEYDDQNFTYSQKVADLPVGKYILKAQAFQRYGFEKNDEAIEDYETNANGNETYNVKTVLFAGNASTPVKNYAAGGREVVTLHGNNELCTYNDSKYPADVDAASDFFELGGYDNELSFVKYDTNDIELGIKNSDDEDAESCDMFSNFRLYYTDNAAVSSMTIDEDADYATLPDRGVEYSNVTVKRKFVKGWNTFCVPMKITAAELKEKLGNPTKIAEFTGVKNNGERTLTLNFTELSGSETITAGTSVMVQFDADVESKTYNLGYVTMDNIAQSTVAVEKTTDDAVVTASFQGTYNKLAGNVASKQYMYVTISGTTITNNKQATSGETVYPSYAVFYLKDKGTRFSTVTETNLAGMPTGIDGISADGDEKDVEIAIYDLQGRRVANTTAGVYIVNGKKVVIR